MKTYRKKKFIVTTQDGKYSAVPIGKLNYRVWNNENGKEWEIFTSDTFDALDMVLECNGNFQQLYETSLKKRDFCRAVVALINLERQNVC